MAKKGGRLKAKDDEELPKAKLTLENFRKTYRLFRYIRPHKWKFLLGMVFLAGTAGIALLFPVLAGQIIGIIANRTKTLETLQGDLLAVGLQLTGVMIAQGVISYGRVLMFSLVSENMLVGIRKDTFTKLIRLPMGFYSKNSISEITSRVATDVNVIGEAFTTSLAEIVRMMVIIIGGMVMLFMFGSGKIALSFITFIPIIALITVIFARKIRKYSREQQNRVAESNVILGEGLQGIANVKSFTNEGHEMKRYDFSVNEIKKFAIKYANLRGIFFAFIITCVFGSVIFLFARIVSLYLGGEINSDNLGKFIMVSLFLAASIGGLPEQIAAIQRAMGASERIFELMDEKGEEINTTFEKVNHKRLPGKVEFKNVSFFYPTRPDFQVLKDVSFIAEKGQTVALVGPSGSGKSTIASLVLRFYDAVEGGIYIDEKLSTDYSLTELRHNMAIVPQDVMLFGGSIKGNIEYGMPGASMDEIIEAARKANALEFIESFPQKFDTIVGDRGIQLSGGQRQRIAIARAVLKNPSILILDEATSSLDSESERAVQDALDKLMEGRTSIVIAHRLSTIKNADKIIVLERGRVKEVGTHAELIELNDGLYRSLSKLQFEIS
ncbi:MAG: ATP-binding cassette domain-containing protein [Bacteroidia bacterium]|nr:ATP-binding cassette domain-containing protein [Bacteroidia bacterium]